MGLFDKLLNRAESLFTHVQDVLGEVTQSWSAAGIEEKVQGVLAQMVIHLAKQPPNVETASQLRINHMAVLLELAESAREFDLDSPKVDELVNVAFESQLEDLVEYLARERPNLSHLVTTLPQELAQEIRKIEESLVKLHELEQSNSKVAAERQTHREALKQNYAKMTEESDYSELEKGSMLGDLAKTLSVGRSIVQSLYDIPRLETAIRENPQDPMGYMDLAEALIRSHQAENIRKGVNVALNPGVFLVYGAGEVLRDVSGGLSKEIVLARTCLTLSRRLLEQDGANFWVLAAAGRAYLLLGEPTLATKYLKLAVLLRPDFADLYYYLAQAYAAKESTKNAISYLIYGVRLGSSLCVVSLYETIEDFEAEDEKTLSHSSELRERLMKVFKEQENDEEGVGILEQFFEEKRDSFRRIGKRLERAIDTLVVGNRGGTR